MAKQEDKERRTPPKTSPMALFVPLLIVTILVGGGALAVVGGKKKQSQEPKAAPASAPKPFEGLPQEAPPKKKLGGGSGAKFVADAPEGLEAEAQWLKAVAIGDAGQALYQEALEAKSANNTALLNEKSKAARDKLNEAVDMTALWEEELLAKYGDANASVRRIMKVRSSWIESLRWLHKSSAR